MTRPTCSGVRGAREAEIDPLARLWHDGWQDAHAAILPAELARHRTFDSFRTRLRDGLARVRVVGADGRPLGFCMTRGDELHQLYVTTTARGSTVAAALLADAEARLRAEGAEIGWLACAIGNARAARFYDKNGWTNVGRMMSELETPNRTFRLEVQRHEKDLRRKRVSR